MSQKHPKVYICVKYYLYNQFSVLKKQACPNNDTPKEY